jgi:D-xylonolactonase
MQPTLIADYRCLCGEGPLWHPTERKLYWHDIGTGGLFRYDPATGAHEPCHQCEPGDTIGGFTIQADGALLLFMARGAVRTWRDGIVKTILPEIPDERDTRFNDVIADPQGRVYCGTMATADRLGRLYRLDPDGTLTRLLEGIGCSNGMGFTPDRQGLYYTDSFKRDIYLFDHDKATGGLTNRRVFVHGGEDDGLPDGMTVDAEGYVWSAHWDGGCLIRYTPDGEETSRVRFPARKVTSVLFAPGPDTGGAYTDIYVTTAGGDHKDTEGAGAGGLFRLNVGVPGVPEFVSRVGLA